MDQGSGVFNSKHKKKSHNKLYDDVLDEYYDSSKECNSKGHKHHCKCNSFFG